MATERQENREKKKGKPCKGVGAKFSSVTMKNVTVKDCNLDYVNFDGARLEKIVIEDTRLNSSNLTQCKCLSLIHI